MNPELLAACHYLSSAIAQAFAALIALTAIFYIYRIQVLTDHIKEVVKSLAVIIDLIARRGRLLNRPVHVQHFRVDLQVDPYGA